MPTLTVVRELSVATTASLGTILSDLEASAGFVGFTGKQASELEDLPARPRPHRDGVLGVFTRVGHFGCRLVSTRVPQAEQLDYVTPASCSRR